MCRPWGLSEAIEAFVAEPSEFRMFPTWSPRIGGPAQYSDVRESPVAAPEVAGASYGAIAIFSVFFGWPCVGPRNAVI